jgi:hypothetical protein
MVGVPPTVMVIDAVNRHLVTDIRLGSSGLGFHQVTAIGDAARVFVPNRTACTSTSRTSTRSGQPSRL